MKELFSLKRNYHGKGSVFFRWDPNCKYLATVGANLRVHIFLRSGELLDEFPASPMKPIISIAWDSEGEYLAILQDSSSIVLLWHVHDKKVKELEINFKDPSFIAWSKNSSLLAVGTGKGNLLLYNAKSMKSQVIQGKHSKKITCGVWNSENRLALAGQDRMLTVSDSNGELLEQTKLKSDPYDLQFAIQKVDNNNGNVNSESTISVNLGKLTILMYNLQEPENPVELAFQPKYGEIVSYKWFGDGYMLVGFNKGYVIAISTHMKEIGEELQSIQLFQSLVDVVASPLLNRMAAAGEDGVKVVDMTDWKEVKSDSREFTKDEGEVDSMEWTRDGQILTVATNGGIVFNFLMQVPTLAAHNGSRIAHLSSLRQITLLDITKDSISIPIEVAVEPSFIALGINQLGVGMNNHAFFYNCSSRHETQLVSEREYLGSVKSMVMNADYAAVLCEGKIHLHRIIPTKQSNSRNKPNGNNNNNNEDDNQTEYKIFPEDSANSQGIAITSMSLTNDFLIYSTSRGSISYFYLKDWAPVQEHRHDTPILLLWSNPLGTRTVFIDSSNKSYLYSPIDDTKVEISSFPPSVDSVLFDPLDTNTFIALDTKVQRQIDTFTYQAQTTRGSIVNKISATKIPVGFTPINFSDGCIFGQKSVGSIVPIVLTSHDAIHHKGRRSTERLRQALTQLLALNRLKQSWDLALIVKSKELWISLARKSMENLDIDLSIRVYRELKDTAMVLSLQQLQHVEDKNYLSGQICLLQSDYNKAQALFVKSSQPVAALTMRRDLLHWEEALKLAATLAPNEIPSICREYASQVEVKGDYAQALAMYQKSLQPPNEEKNSKSSQPITFSEEHLKISNGGIARMTLRTGDLPRGLKLAQSSGDKSLMKECAAILESMKQYSDAADLYLQADQYEKAASIYNLTKNFHKAGPLMDKITTPKIHAQYAKAKEAEKDYAAASIAYERARDLDSVIRLNLQYLDNPSKAFAIARQTKSSDGAQLVANYCIANQDFQSAVEFMLMAKRSAEAFQMAKQHKQMDKYAAALGEDGNQDEYLQIALYYEEIKDYVSAGHFHSIVGDYSRALKLYLLCDTNNIDDAINVVKKSQGQPGSEILIRQLHDYLIGETDGKVKDLNYIFRLYITIQEFTQAEKTAILISNQEQQLGQYNTAHNILFAMNQDLISHKITPSMELKKNLLLLHSYTLAKRLAASKEHEMAARMLIRVARSISKFPSHIVPILTSTVIECQRAGLKSSSFEYASMLMRAEYRESIDKKYRKPIEQIVRRPVNEETEEKTSPCPYCQFELPDSLLDCPSCKNNLPFCISTGMHMILSDWSQCPSCSFPTRYSSFIERINIDKSCAMCGKVIHPHEINKISSEEAKNLLMKSNDSNSSSSSEENNNNNDMKVNSSSSLPGPPILMDAVDIPVSF